MQSLQRAASGGVLVVRAGGRASPIQSSGSGSSASCASALIGAEDPLGPLGLYATSLRPVPVPVRVRVVLVGPQELYAALLESDADFASLFRVKVEVEPAIDQRGAPLAELRPRREHAGHDHRHTEIPLARGLAIQQSLKPQPPRRAEHRLDMTVRQRTNDPEGFPAGSNRTPRSASVNASIASAGNLEMFAIVSWRTRLPSLTDRRTRCDTYSRSPCRRRILATCIPPRSSAIRYMITQPVDRKPVLLLAYNTANKKAGIPTTTRNRGPQNSPTQGHFGLAPRTTARRGSATSRRWG